MSDTKTNGVGFMQYRGFEIFDRPIGEMIEHGTGFYRLLPDGSIAYVSHDAIYIDNPPESATSS